MPPPITAPAEGAIRGVAPTQQRAQSSSSSSAAGARSDVSEVLVKTEFVWADGAENDVKLSGAWNGWMPIQMYHEGGGMWSVVTPVPVGTHEFKFVVDEEWKHSTRHPTVGDEPATMNNIRVIKGPPKPRAATDVGTHRAAGNAPAGAAVATAKRRKGCCVMM